MAETVRIEGLAELRRALRELPKAVQGRVLRNALRAGGRLIETEARARAPAATGRLARNIRTVAVRQPRGKTLLGQAVAASADASAAVQVGVRAKGKKDSPRNAFYWRFLEFGTSKLRARPFMRPAFEARKRDAVEVFAQRLDRRIQAEAKRLAHHRR